MYTAFWQNSLFGTPILRPLAYLDQTDTETLYRNDEFAVGDHILICPVMRPGISERTVYIPRGNWFNIWNDHEYHGGKEHVIGCPIDRMPVFIRAGAVIPQWPKQQYVGELEVIEVSLHVYFNKGKEVLSYLYEDAGDNYGYKMGLSKTHKFYVKGNSKNFIISHIVEGDFETNKTFKIVVHGIPFQCKEFVIDGKSHSITERNLAVGTIKFKADKEFKRIILR